MNQSTLKISVYTLLLLATLTSCNSSSKPNVDVEKTPTGMISKKEAVEMAKKEFLEGGHLMKGESIEDYNITVKESEKEWEIAFKYKWPAIGKGDFIIIDKRTGKIRHGIIK